MNASDHANWAGTARETDTPMQQKQGSARVFQVSRVCKRRVVNPQRRQC